MTQSGSTTQAEEHRRAAALPAGRLTFLFTDIEGSTRLFREVGHRYVEALQLHRELIRAALAAHDGIELSTSGDSFFAVFEDATAAAAASVAAQRALLAAPWPAAARLRVRMGLHTGEAAPFGGDYVSIVVHQASRVAAAAHGGQVLVSSATAAEITHLDGVSCRPLGEFVLRDFDAPERLHQLDIDGCERDFPAPRTAPVAKHNLPARSTSFVGRQDTLDTISGLLREQRSVTLVGAGGLGKTRVAIEVAELLAEELADGARLIELAPLRDDWAVPAAVAAAFGVPAPGDRGQGSLAARLGGLEALVVLDNCEHLLDAAAECADELLRGTSGLRVLLTSRSPVRFAGEHLHRLDPLPVPEAAQLLVTRARDSGARIGDTELTRIEAAALSELVDGMPLAVELIAAHAGHLTLSELARRVRDGELRPARRGGDPRQRSVEATLAWSWDLLDGDAQTAWRRLSVLTNGATRDLMVELIAFSPLTTRGATAAVDRLVEDSVLTPVAGGEGRLRLLEPLREHGLATLTADEEQQTRQRLRSALAARYSLAFTRPFDLDGATRHRADIIASLRLEPADGDVAHLAAALANVMIYGVAPAEELALLEEAVAACGGFANVPPAIGRVVAQCLRLMGRLPRAREVLDGAFQAAKGDAVQLIGLELGLGDLCFAQGERTAMAAHYQRAWELATEAGAADHLPFCLLRLGELAGYAGDMQRARELLAEAISVEQMPLRRYLAVAQLAEVLIHLGDLEGADVLRRELGEYAASSNADAAELFESLTSELAGARGDHEAALRHSARAYAQAQRDRPPLGRLYLLNEHARCLLRAGAPAAECGPVIGEAIDAALAVAGGPAWHLLGPLLLTAAWWPEDSIAGEALALAAPWVDHPLLGDPPLHRDLAQARSRFDGATLPTPRPLADFGRALAAD